MNSRSKLLVQLAIQMQEDNNVQNKEICSSSNNAEVKGNSDSTDEHNSEAIGSTEKIGKLTGHELIPGTVSRDGSCSNTEIHVEHILCSEHETSEHNYASNPMEGSTNPASFQMTEFIVVPCGEEYILQPISKSSEKNSPKINQDTSCDDGILDRQMFLAEENNFLLSDENMQYNDCSDINVMSEELSVEDIIDLEVPLPLVEESIAECGMELPFINNVANEQEEVCSEKTNIKEITHDEIENKYLQSDSIDNIIQDTRPNDNGAQTHSEQNNNENVHGPNSSKVIPGKNKRNAKRKKHAWAAVKNKFKRMMGQAYCGRRKNDAGKSVFDVSRAKRELKPRCLCCSTNKISVFQCTRLTEENRKKLFQDFWSLNWGERRILVKQLVDHRTVAQRRVNSLEFRRKGSLYYHLRIGQNEDRLRVCKTMFLNTLSLGEWMVSNWVVDSPEGQECQEVDRQEESEDDAGEGNCEGGLTKSKTGENRQKKDKYDSSHKNIVREFFSRLPKLESHYCRKDTKKLYLEPKWQSKAELFRQYQSYCKSEGKESLCGSIFTFYSVFEELNLGLFSPKKDQCDVCCSFNKGNLAQEEYDAHVVKKTKARQEKERDKTSNNTTAVFTMDVQAVLLCPALKASALYYRSKLKIHNFTVYNLKTGNAFCYLWDETEGGLTADEFSSIISHFISTEVDKSIYDGVIFYSDGCTYQSRNCTLSNAFLLASYETGLTITQKFLEKGHTQMECDSIHSTIEKKLRNREIYSPAGYIEVCRTARIHPKPYNVQYLYHDFFKKYSTLNFVSSIRPGKKKGDPVVTDLKCIEYSQDGSIKVKLDFSDEYSDLPRRIKQPTDIVLQPLHKTKLPLEASKFQHLQEMKGVLPRDVHVYYDRLPHYMKNLSAVCSSEALCTCVKKFF